MNEISLELECTAFESMNRGEQMASLQREGVYIGKQKRGGETGEKTTLLYRYQNIYVEILYTLHRAHIEEIRCLSVTAHLQNYFAQEDFHKNIS